MNEKEKNVTNDKDYPFIKLRRLDCLPQTSKDGEEFYLISGLYKQDDRTLQVDFFTKDKDLYDEVLAIPAMTDFKLHYELRLGLDGKFIVKPVACSL